ncbi:amino acid adenylation domain-containing protein [Kitasatospora sp. NBC_00240]|uniref:non-ribosomal peptide synthetase n=1 Tax=Kitasatospora sp. NBC_00240 TaxID=2903567 RepID=UPI00225BFADC|nr:amino acid adenylation domain-containing protein [Kitasatospora sp. NBC_00240]MCX5208730.1 amino acid adenylation domain-containing protein [Kitasatospora sp. NBC_00240]
MPEQLPDRSAIPAGPAQQGVWLTERLLVTHEAYHLPVRIAFAAVDPDALEHAVDALVARHPLLATALVEREGDVLLVPAGQRPALQRVDAEQDSAADFEKRVGQDAARPFTLGTGPAARFTLYRRPDGQAELLAVAHHAVFDGASKEVLVNDLAAGYAAALPGAARAQAQAEAPAVRPAAPGPDPETVRRAAQWFGPRWAAATEPVLPGGARATTGAGPGESVGWTLDAPAREALAGAAAQSGVTVFEFLLAALHGLLHRYGGEAVPVSVPLSTRTAGQAGEIGLFVNELPVHAPTIADVDGVADPVGSTGFDRWAQAVRAELRGGYPFRTVPFGAAVAALGPRVGLAPVSFGYRLRGPQPEFAGTSARVDWAVFNGTARNTLNLQVVDAPDGTGFALQHDPAVLAPDAARRIARHYATLLAGAVAAPRTPLGDLPLLDAEEHRLVTEAFNATERAYPADRTVLDLVREQAAATPDAVAVSAGPDRVGYRELIRRADQLAAGLRAAGAGPGTLVALHLHRTADLPAALLAVLATGAAYLPLDPGYPQPRLAAILADSGAALLLADRDPAPALVAVAPAVLRLDACPAAGAGTATADPAAPAATDTAYVLYTSGSTGRPKGVAVGHRALANLLHSFAGRLESGPQDVWLGLTSLSFDISALEIYLPLITGGRLVLAPDGLAVDGAGLLDLIRREGVTHVQATPSGWRVLLSAGPGRTRLVALAGGEALPLPLARELRSAVGRLFNVYGPTETTIWSTCAEIPAGPTAVTIGRPIANTRAQVVDSALRPVPIGVPGELLLGGDGVAEGYLGRPELTAERFVEDPYGPPGARRYRTGDLAAWTVDGELDFLGRADNQVKIRGHRIELGEIEARLLEHPAVAEAAVAVHQDAVGEPRLAGYLVTTATPGPSAAELREHLLGTLPAAMVPQVYVPLPAMPLTPNGKLDRRALPEPPAEVAAPQGRPAPADELQEQLCGIWAEVLGLPEVGLEDDLFDLGGHSLTIIQISARIRQALGVEVDFDVFFDSPTVAGIADAVRERR